MTPAGRKKLRTALLGVSACCALFWGAVDIVGVPAENLLCLLVQVSLGTLVVIGGAVVAALIMISLRRFKRR